MLDAAVGPASLLNGFKTGPTDNKPLPQYFRHAQLPDNYQIVLLGKVETANALPPPPKNQSLKVLTFLNVHISWALSTRLLEMAEEKGIQVMCEIRGPLSKDKVR